MRDIKPIIVDTINEDKEENDDSSSYDSEEEQVHEIGMEEIQEIISKQFIINMIYIYIRKTSYSRSTKHYITNDKENISRS